MASDKKDEMAGIRSWNEVLVLAQERMSEAVERIRGLRQRAEELKLKHVTDELDEILKLLV